MKSKQRRGRMNGMAQRRLACGLLALAMFVSGVQTTWLAPTAHASKVDDLTAQAESLKQEIAANKEELSELKEFAQNEEKEKANIEKQLDTLNAQIEVLLELINQVQENINTKQEEIATATADIAVKEVEYADALTMYRARLAAMQEVKDSGAVAVLSAVQNLYQLLTFGEVFQSITDYDTELLDNIEAQRLALETLKTNLETAKEALQADFDALDVQRAELNTAQASYNANLLLVSDSLEEAEQAKAELEEKIEEQSMEYSAVEAEIAALISGSAGEHGDLEMTGGFMVPLPSGSYWISRGFISGHPAIDYAAGAWTPIYASAAGYVTAAGWNSGGYGNYVLIYHGEMSGNTYTTLYAHMVQSPSVTNGQYVTQGTLIGYVGNTGNSRGNHLHFELWSGSTINNSVANKATRIDPAPYGL